MRYECTRDGHNKFWEYEGPRRTQRGFQVITNWGRIGNTPQSKTQYFLSMSDADDFILMKVREKQGKGYVEVGEEPTPRSMSDIWYPNTKKTSTKKVEKPAPKKDEGIDPIDFDLATADAVKK